MASVFFSYSHANETQRDQLEMHFAMLKREGLIETWHDRRLNAGDEFDSGIKAELERADIILFLVSPEFLASKYCFDVELTRAIERHVAKEARVIPIILDSCDWHASPLGKLLAVPTDGKPISKFPNPNDGYLEVVKAIRTALQETGATPEQATASSPSSVTPTASAPDARSSNLGIRKEFSDHDRDQFLLDSFEFIQKFFEQSLKELEARNPDVQTRFRLVDSNRFTAEIYRNGEATTTCSIGIAGHGLAGRHSITYGTSLNSNAGSFGDAVSVTDDERTLGFAAMNMGMMVGRGHGQRDDMLSEEGAAEYLWSRLIQPLQ